MYALSSTLAQRERLLVQLTTRPRPSVANCATRAPKTRGRVASLEVVASRGIRAGIGRVP
jgi:DNA repair photolyase